MRSGAAPSSLIPEPDLAALAERIRPLALRREDHLPVLPALTGLLPGEGLRRGSTVAVLGDAGGGATSLALALVAATSRAGSWVAAVGLPSLGLVAADELGVALERLVLVAAPERSQWGSVTAALVDGFDCVVVAAHRGVPASAARRLVARARERGAVLIALGAGWPEPASVQLHIARTRWEGIEPGHGHLQARKVRVAVGGRGDASRPRTVDLWLPTASGEVLVAEPAAPARPVSPLPLPLPGPAGPGAGPDPQIAVVAGERPATRRSPAPGSPGHDLVDGDPPAPEGRPPRRSRPLRAVG